MPGGAARPLRRRRRGVLNPLPHPRAPTTTAPVRRRRARCPTLPHHDRRDHRDHRGAGVRMRSLRATSALRQWGDNVRNRAPLDQKHTEKSVTKLRAMQHGAAHLVVLGQAHLAVGRRVGPCRAVCVAHPHFDVDDGVDVEFLALARWPPLGELDVFFSLLQSSCSRLSHAVLDLLHQLLLLVCWCYSCLNQHSCCFVCASCHP